MKTVFWILTAAAFGFDAVGLLADSIFPMDEQTLAVKIELQETLGHTIGFGSGFYFGDSTNVYLVTARHVVFSEGAPFRLHAPFAVATSSPPVSGNDRIARILNFEILSNSGCIFWDTNHDIVAIKVSEQTGPAWEHSIHGVRTAFTSVTNRTFTSFTGGLVGGYSNAVVGDDVYFFGYPNSLGIPQAPEIDYNRPLLRKGIVAQKNESAHTIIVDAPSYPGNSGGPVMIREEVPGGHNFTIIGVVTEFVPYVDTWVSQRSGAVMHTELYNSGYTVVEPIEAIKALIHQPPGPIASSTK